MLQCVGMLFRCGGILGSIADFLRLLTRRPLIRMVSAPCLCVSLADLKTSWSIDGGLLALLFLVRAIFPRLSVAMLFPPSLGSRFAHHIRTLRYGLDRGSREDGFPWRIFDVLRLRELNRA